MRRWIWKIGGGLLRLPRLIPAWWRREYADFRVILEQEGQLHYYLIPSRIQRRTVQALILLGGAVGLILVGLLATSLRLAWTKRRLERSHLAIYQALLGSSPVAEGAGTQSNQVFALIRALQERQAAIRQYLDLSSQLYTGQNQTLLGELKSTGLTEQAIRTIERTAAFGGSDPQAKGSVLPSNLLPDPLVQEILQNRHLLEVMRALPARLPLAGWELSSDYGIRRHPVTGVVHFHTGVDLTVAGGDDRVYPVKAGEVILAQEHPQLGNLVIVRHSHGIETLYGHLATLSVKPGQAVTPETLLGRVGNTGLSTGPHLHFEVSVGGYPTHPLKVIKAAHHVQQIAGNQRVLSAS